MLDYLSDYRTQDKLRGVHYYPVGALCWFECDQYGNPTGSVYYARKIPDIKLFKEPKRKRGLKGLTEAQNRTISIKEKFTKEKADTEQWETVKPRFEYKRKDC